MNVFSVAIYVLDAQKVKLIVLIVLEDTIYHNYQQLKNNA